MPEKDLTAAHNARNNVSSSDVGGPSQIPFSFLKKISNKTTRLLANSGDAARVDGRNRWYEFSFKDPVFVTTVMVEFEGYDTFDKFECAWITAFGVEATGSAAIGATSTIFAINQYINSISFRPPMKFFSNPKINSVTIYGFSVEETGVFLEKLSSLEGLRQGVLSECDKAIGNATDANQKISDLETTIGELSEDFKSLKNEQKSIQGAIGSLTEQRHALQSNIGILKKQEVEIKEILNTIDQNIDEKNIKLNSISSDVAKNEIKLSSLKSDINLFPTELSSFVDQGSQAIKFYAILFGVPVAIIFCMFVMLVSNAADLTTILKREPDADIWSMFLTRIPYVTIAAAIVAASYQIARVFAQEIIKINRQKLNLTKISIIATDISNSAEHELDMDDEDRYNSRVALKMYMLRDHMKEYISKDFVSSLPKKLGLFRRPSMQDSAVVEEIKRLDAPETEVI